MSPPEKKERRRTVLVTGSEGFMGRNLCLALQRQGGLEILGFDVGNSADDLLLMAGRADLVFHLAGVNRPQTEQEFQTGNADLTRRLCDCLQGGGRTTPLVLSLSI